MTSRGFVNGLLITLGSLLALSGCGVHVSILGAIGMGMLGVGIAPQ